MLYNNTYEPFCTPWTKDSGLAYAKLTQPTTYTVT